MTKILLVGDSCYDEYHFGTVTRISPEAPIPVFDKIKSYMKQGMASNVYDNFFKLGVDIHIITQFMERKHRYIDIKSNQQLLRVDEKCEKEIAFDDAEDIFNMDLSSYDALVISDYDKGFLSYETISRIIKEYHGPIFIDTKKRDLKRFEGCVVKINEHEYNQRISDCSDIIVTYGSEKVEYHGQKFTPPKVEAYDVCGAGDTFLASLAYKFVVDKDMKDAIIFAMKAAAITVQHIGVYAPTVKEIEND